jgi:peptide/nickel transport system permease protein
MIAYIVRRLLFAIPILIGISLVSFMIIKSAPGDPMGMFFDPNINQNDLENFRLKYGLDDPILQQYAKWLFNMVQGDFGYSISRTGTPVIDLIMSRMPNTFLLMGVSFLLTLLISIPLGVFSAKRPYSRLDYTLTTGSFMGLATPSFWFGLMLIMVFSVQLGWFPTGGVATINEPFSIWDRIHHLILPAFVLATADMAGLTRYTRASMLEVLNQDFIRTARSKGLSENRVVYKHGLRNGLLPIVTIIGLSLPGLFGGAVITENIFTWPGLGRLFVEASFERDYPVVMGITVIASILVVIGNLIADILYAVVDPRIDYSKERG